MKAMLKIHMHYFLPARTAQVELRCQIHMDGGDNGLLVQTDA